MKIPNKVKIGAHYYDIIFKSPDEMDECIGLCKPTFQKIFIRNDLTESKMIEVFIHECIHAIDEDFILKLGETRVNNLALHLYQWLNDNGLLNNEERTSNKIKRSVRSTT